MCATALLRNPALFEEVTAPAKESSSSTAACCSSPPATAAAAAATTTTTSLSTSTPASTTGLLATAARARQRYRLILEYLELARQYPPPAKYHSHYHEGKASKEQPLQQGDATADEGDDDQLQYERYHLSQMLGRSGAGARINFAYIGGFARGEEETAAGEERPSSSDSSSRQPRHKGALALRDALAGARSHVDLEDITRKAFEGCVGETAGR